MNTDKNKQKWIKRVKEILEAGKKVILLFETTYMPLLIF